MNTTQRKALENAGWRVGDAGDFLGLTDEERQLVALRANLAIAIRNRRKARRWTQAQLADRLKTSQPRVARIEDAAGDVSLDQMYRAWFALGGTAGEFGGAITPTARNKGTPEQPERPRKSAPANRRRSQPKAEASAPAKKSAASKKPKALV